MTDRDALREGHIVVLGQTGLGKTALVRTWVRGRRDWPRVLVLDPHREYGDVAVAVESLDAWAAYVARAQPTWRVAYWGDDLDDVLPAICEAVYEIGQVHLVVEEADYWATPGAILPDLAHVFKYGRHRQVWVVAVARRPSEVHRLCTSQARHVWACATVEPRDVDYLRLAVSAEYAAAAAALQPLQAVWWDRRTRVLTRVRIDPAAGTVQQEEEALTAAKQPAVG
jgi:hypothetical protein